jgi:methylphosphotriester-DNA--protein-cysteine methyltransferase
VLFHLSVATWTTITEGLPSTACCTHLLEPHVQHLVRLVQDGVPHAVKPQGATLNQVNHTTRGANLRPCQRCTSLMRAIRQGTTLRSHTLKHIVTMYQQSSESHLWEMLTMHHPQEP